MYLLAMTDYLRVINYHLKKNFTFYKIVTAFKNKIFNVSMYWGYWRNGFAANCAKGFSRFRFDSWISRKTYIYQIELSKAY